MAISLELAISAIRSGRKEEGRQLLNLLIQQNPNDDKVWLWMSSVVDTDEQRARCLYHVLAVNPKSELARRGLQVLGITVSDSRPVKIPRDSQPIQIPKPAPESQLVPAQPKALMAGSPAIPMEPGKIHSAPRASTTDQAEPSQPRRPFLIDPETITKELPFTPLQTPLAEPIQASPGILQIDVEAVVVAETETSAASTSVSPTQTQKMISDLPLSSGSEAAASLVQPLVQNEVGPGSGDLAKTNRMTETQRMDPGPGQVRADQPPIAEQQFVHTPSETRPSQPVPVAYPPMSMSPSPAGQMPYYPMPPAQGFANHANVTLGMSPAHYPQPQPQPGQFILPGYAAPTLGMPLPVGQPAYPAGPIPAIHSNATVSMTPFEQQQLSQMLALHSSATMMMPPMTEMEARARLVAGQAIPTANATAMALQTSANGRGMAYQQPAYSDPETEEEEPEGGDFNILAVIIFGTLSVTALGGFGMLILLVFTSPLG